MPFSVEDIRDLVRVLDEKPEWRAEIRRLILDGELSAVHDQIAESRAATEQHLQRVERQIADSHAATARRIDKIDQRISDNDRRISRIDQRISRIDQRSDAIHQEIAELRAANERHTHAIKGLTVDVADLKGYGLEERYRRMASAYFGSFMRRTRVVERNDHSRMVDDAESAGVLSDQEAAELLWLDLIVRGRRKSGDEEVYLAVEVSWTIGESDVERAARRAALLQRIKSPALALAVAAGKFLSEEVAARARDENVWVFVEGTPYPPDRHDIGP